MESDQFNPSSDGGVIAISAAGIVEMLASLQEAVVTADVEPRRALIKGVIARLQDALAAGGPG